MLPRTDILINRIRQESDTTDINALDDFTLINYINDAQRAIQSIIFQADNLNNVFVARKKIAAVPGQIEYNLPDDVYADSSIIGVFAIDSQNTVHHRYSLSTLGEHSGPFRYSVENKKIILSHEPSYDVLVQYNYRMPFCSKRAGKVTGVSGQVVSISNALSDFETVTEYVSIVDKYGNIVSQGHYIDDYTFPDLTVEGDLTGVAADHYVVSGKSSSSHSHLPMEAETALKVFVQRKVMSHLNSKKIADAQVFTEEERKDLMDLFEDKHSDIQYPTLTDTDYLDY